MHGLDFQDAVQVFAGPMLERIDRRRDYGEVRINAIGAMDRQIVVNVTWTRRDGRTRLISARLATRDERALYRDFQLRPPGGPP